LTNNSFNLSWSRRIFENLCSWYHTYSLWFFISKLVLLPLLNHRINILKGQVPYITVDPETKEIIVTNMELNVLRIRSKRWRHHSIY
jgi:hypothetical protein